MTRVPYGTLIATILCVVGVGVFCGGAYRGAMLARLMLEKVFSIQPGWLEPTQMALVVLGACTGAVGLLVLVVGCLATGETRARVYRAWRARVGGRVSCGVLMGLCYGLWLTWCAIFLFVACIGVTCTFCWMLCYHMDGTPNNQQIDFRQFWFLFPEGTKREHMVLDQQEKVREFCKDYVERAEVMFVLALGAAFLVVLSLTHYLMCLSANYAHIKDHEKLQDLQEMQFLQESEMSALSKDRF